ncbi:hypothetical protein AB0O75_33850 [Streptomyces sp. NPDC088921]|uniref:hypothetical protein n=1 Tax=unclassified Streptomyces TaxID=2593676 RepID=UPI003434F720
MNRPRSAPWLPLFDDLAFPQQPVHAPVRAAGFLPAPREHPDELAEVVGSPAAPREGRMTSEDIAVGLPLGVGPGPYARAGAMWWLPALRDGPAA